MQDISTDLVSTAADGTPTTTSGIVAYCPEYVDDIDSVGDPA